MHIGQPSVRLATILLIPVITGLALAVRRRRVAARRRTLSERQAATVPPNKPTPPVAGWHRRPLPPPAIALSSADGRTLAKAAISLGSMETFFALAEVFETLSLSLSLTLTLNLTLTLTLTLILTLTLTRSSRRSPSLPSAG